MRWRTICFMSVLSLLGFGRMVFAHQPVMDMAPRWENGYGFQTRFESRYANDLIDGDSKIDNPHSRDRRVTKIWYEGVYTWHRAVRLTFKYPYINQSRRVIKNGVPMRQADSGFGDLIVGLPLKLYENRSGMTHNIGFAPSIRLPTGSTSSDFPVGDGSTDVGLSLSYSLENPFWSHFYDLFYWFNTRGKKGIAEGDVLGFDANVGIHPYHNNETNSGLFLMADAGFRYQDRGVDRGGTTGGTRLTLGPVLVLYRQNVMFRAEYKIPVYEQRNGTQVAHGNEINLGIGITF